MKTLRDFQELLWLKREHNYYSFQSLPGLPLDRYSTRRPVRRSISSMKRSFPVNDSLPMHHEAILSHCQMLLALSMLDNTQFVYSRHQKKPENWHQNPTDLDLPD